MKKLRFQPTFASLTEAEFEQLAEAVQRETYDAVRERICKPRSHGGLDLNFTSNSPLFRLHEKKNKLDLLNARLRAQCPEQKKVTLSDLNAFISFEKHAPEEVHEAILGLTYDLVTERDHTPHQLLALQRLADFPARSALRDQMAALRAQNAEDLSRLRERAAEIRAERLNLARAQEQRAQAKAQREAEMHLHKISMDTFRKQIALDRLAFAQRSFHLRESVALARLNSANVAAGLGCEAPKSSSVPSWRLTSTSDHSSTHYAEPSANDITSIQDHGRGAVRESSQANISSDVFHPRPTSILRDATNDTNTTPAHPYPQSNPLNALNSETQNSKSKTQNSHLRIISPRPLPPAVIEANLRYAEKVRTGKIIIDRSGPWLRAVELDAADPQNPPNPQSQPQPEANPRPLSASG